MADMNAVWAGVRTYMMSGRTNPPPGSFVQTIRSLGLTASEKDWLAQKARAWPGNPGVGQQTANDITQA